MSLRLAIGMFLMLLAIACNPRKEELVLQAEVPTLVHARDAVAKDWHSGSSIWDVSTLHLDPDGTFDYTLRGCVFNLAAHGHWHRSALGIILTSVGDPTTNEQAGQPPGFDQKLTFNNSILSEQMGLLICVDNQSPLFGAKFRTDNTPDALKISQPILTMKLR